MFTDAGIQVVAMAIGEPKHAVHFCGRLAPEIACLTNPGTEAHRTYGLQRGGLKQLLAPAVFKASLRAHSKGHTQGQATGDTTMLPGTFLIDQQGIIQFVHYSQHAGDHPVMDQLIGAAKLLQTR